MVNGQKFTMPTAYTPAGKMVSLLSHARFHRLRFQQVKGTNSPLDPRLTEYWEDRRTNALLRRAFADMQQTRVHFLKRQKSRCAITGLPLEEMADFVLHRIVPKDAGGNDDWNNLCFVLKWAQTALQARLKAEQQLASLKDVPFSGL
jgi:hypothetical protein